MASLLRMRARTMSVLAPAVCESLATQSVYLSLACPVLLYVVLSLPVGYLYKSGSGSHFRVLGRAEWSHWVMSTSDGVSG